MGNDSEDPRHAGDVKDSLMADNVRSMLMVCGGWTVFGVTVGLLLAFVCTRYFLNRAGEAGSVRAGAGDADLGMTPSTDSTPTDGNSLNDVNEVHSYANPQAARDRASYVYISLYQDNILSAAIGQHQQGQRTPHGLQQIPEQRGGIHQQQQHQEQQQRQSVLPVSRSQTPHTDTSPTDEDSSQTQPSSCCDGDEACHPVNGDQACTSGKDDNSDYPLSGDRHVEPVRASRIEPSYLELVADDVDAVSAGAEVVCRSRSGGAAVSIAERISRGDSASLKAEVVLGDGEPLRAKVIIIDDDLDNPDHLNTVIVVNVADDHRKLNPFQSDSSSCKGDEAGGSDKSDSSS